MKSRARVICLELGLAAILAGTSLSAIGRQGGFLGRWNLTGTGADSAMVYWLEITQDGGQLSGMFLNRGGAPARLAGARIENGELVFQGAARRAGPGPEGRARLQGDKLVGTITSPGTAAAPGRAVEFVGAHPAEMAATDASAPHTVRARRSSSSTASRWTRWTWCSPDQPWSSSTAR